MLEELTTRVSGVALYVRASIRTRIRSERGASAVEYGLLIAAIAAVIVAIVFGLGTIVRGTYKDTCDKFNSHVSSASGSCPSS